MSHAQSRARVLSGVSAACFLPRPPSSHLDHHAMPTSHVAETYGRTPLHTHTCIQIFTEDIVLEIDGRRIQDVDLDRAKVPSSRLPAPPPLPSFAESFPDSRSATHTLGLSCMCAICASFSARIFHLEVGTTGSEKEQGCIVNHEGVMHTYTRTHSGTVPWSSRVHCSVGHQSCRTHVQRGRDEDSACNLRPNRYSPPKSLRQDFKTRVVYDGP